MSEDVHEGGESRYDDCWDHEGIHISAGLKKWIVAIQDMPSKQPFVFAHLLLHAGDGSPWDAGKKYR